MGIAEEFFRSQVENVLEVINDERDEKIVLSKEDMEDIVASFLNDDVLWQDIDYAVRDAICSITGKEVL